MGFEGRFKLDGCNSAVKTIQQITQVLSKIKKKLDLAWYQKIQLIVKGNSVNIVYGQCKLDPINLR